MCKVSHIKLDGTALFFIRYIFKPVDNGCSIFPLVYIGIKYQDFITILLQQPTLGKGVWRPRF